VSRAFCLQKKNEVNMPKNVPAELEDKFASCKEKVIASGQDEQAAYGICYMSVVEGKSMADATKSYYLDTAAVKYGRTISAANAELIKGIISLAKQLIPDEEPAEAEAEAEPIDMPAEAMQPVKDGELLVSYGSAVKSIGGKLGGYAVRFSGKDLSGEGFSRETNYGFAGDQTKKVDILLHHAQPMETKTGRRVQVTEPIGVATLKMADDGIVIDDAILYTAERYAKYLDKLGWSTGAAAHAVVRDGATIKQWQIAEVSLTPFPAEPRNMVAAKSLENIVMDIDDAAEMDYQEIGRQVGAALYQQIRQAAG
jgi:phage head maturation protease